MNKLAINHSSFNPLLTKNCQLLLKSIAAEQLEYHYLILN